MMEQREDERLTRVELVLGYLANGSFLPGDPATAEAFRELRELARGHRAAASGVIGVGQCPPALPPAPPPSSCPSEEPPLSDEAISQVNALLEANAELREAQRARDELQRQGASDPAISEIEQTISTVEQRVETLTAALDGVFEPNKPPNQTAAEH